MLKQLVRIRVFGGAGCRVGLRFVGDGTRRRRRAPRFSPAIVEPLEDRVLPAVALLIDYSLDNGFFTADRRAAIESVASELGARLADSLAAIPTGTYTVTDPKTFTQTTATFSAPADAIRVYVAGSSLSGGTLAIGGWRTNTGIRNFDRGTDFQPYVGYVGFNLSTNWNTNDTAGSGQANFQAVARHELLHVLGIGGAATWDALLSNGVFTGPKTWTANGGAYPPVTSDGGHFADGVNSIMGPYIDQSITRPTAVDWAAIDDIGWDVIAAPPAGTYADVFGRTADGTWWASQNFAAATGLASPAAVGQWNESAGWRDVQTGDVNGDGRIDVLGRTATGAWWVGLNTGGQFANRYFGGWYEAAGWSDVLAGDFTGDGLTDVAGRTAAGEWYVARSTGTSFVSTRWSVWNESVDWRDVTVGDFDGDRRDDLVGRTHYGEWWVARSTGAAFTNVRFGAWYEAAGWHDVVTADFDSDGRTDVAGRSSYGEWYVGLSQGTHFSTGRWAVWDGSAGWRGVVVGDVFGDGRPDILARTATGAWFVGISSGTGFGTYHVGQWNEGAGWRDLMAGQFSGSGHRDVLARAADGSWWVGENTGGSFVFRAFGQWNESLGWRDVASSRGFYVSVAGVTGGADADATSSPSGSSPAIASSAGEALSVPAETSDESVLRMDRAEPRSEPDDLRFPPVALQDRSFAHDFNVRWDGLFSEAGLFDELLTAAGA